MESMQTEEALLVTRVKAGEAECFPDLIRPHARSMYWIAYSVLKNAVNAEDVVQEATFKALQRLDQWRGESPFKNWLLRIVLNEARMKLRREHQEAWVSLDEEVFDAEGELMPRDLADWREIPPQALERKELRAQLLRALEGLPAHYREVFVLRDVQHLAEKEAAEVLGISVNTVKMRLHRARLRLREELAPIFKKRWSDRLPGLRGRTC